MLTETTVQNKVDSVIRQYKTTPIKYYPYASGAVDVFKQRIKTFGTPVTLVGRAIHRPTPEQITVIGDGEEYDIAFLFSKIEMDLKFPSATDGEWIDTYGQMEWRDRRYKIEKVAPTGQVGTTFSMVVALANTIPGQRDP